MLAALMDGRALTAGELGFVARIAPSTASGHLAKLVEGNLLAVTSSGRHRYYRLRSTAVADALESLMSLAADGPPRYRPAPACGAALARARTCYDHLAGKLAIELADSLARREMIILAEDGAVVTDTGLGFLRQFGIDLDRRRPSRRPFCRACMDWSERRWHVGGWVGAAVAARAFDLGLIERQRDSRAVTITSAGERAFEDWFGVKVPA